MIKTKLGLLSQASMSLAELMQQSIPISVSVKVALLIKKFNAEVQVFDETRRALFKELGKDDKDGNRVIPDANREEFNAKFKELCDQEVELKVQPMQLDALGNIDISAKALLSLEEAGLLILEAPKP